MAVIQPDTLEGTIGGRLWFHLDLTNDVLYLRLADRRHCAAVGEQTEDGDILLRDEETDDVIGLTVLNWWGRHGQGIMPDSIVQLAARIEPMASRIAA